MTQDEIIEMARQAGIGWGEGIGEMTDFLEAFAKLVAAKERSACANIAHQWSKREDDVGGYIESAIRARGQA